MSVRSAIRVLAFLGLVGGVPGYALAQEQPGIGVVSTLIGEATVARAGGFAGSIQASHTEFMSSK